MPAPKGLTKRHPHSPVYLVRSGRTCPVVDHRPVEPLQVLRPGPVWITSVPGPCPEPSHPNESPEDSAGLPEPGQELFSRMLKLAPRVLVELAVAASCPLAPEGTARLLSVSSAVM